MSFTARKSLVVRKEENKIGNVFEIVDALLKLANNVMKKIQRQLESFADLKLSTCYSDDGVYSEAAFTPPQKSVHLPVVGQKSTGVTLDFKNISTATNLEVYFNFHKFPCMSLTDWS